MKTLYIGNQSSKKSNGINWKVYFFLILISAFLVMTLKLTGAMIVEKLINRNGAKATGFAISIRDVDIALAKGQLHLKDVKMFNDKTSSEFLEAPELTIQLSLPDLFFTQEKKITVSAEKLNLILSKDLSSELGRSKDHYLDMVEGHFGKLTITEKKEDQSRTVIDLVEANVKIKESDFIITSKIADGGNLNLNGKEKNHQWTITGSLKHVPSTIFNKIAGNKLPFDFAESTLNANINGESTNGSVSGEISPEITKLNLIDAKPGIPTQTIKRVLSDEVTFSLPFTLKDELTLQYADTFNRLKTYRKPGPVAAAQEARVTQATPTPKNKKAFSFWPF